MSDTERIRILLVDDHRMVIDGIRAILDQEPEFEIVGDACNGREAVERTKELSPDVVIMDISMPEMDGIEATRIIRAEHLKQQRSQQAGEEGKKKSKKKKAPVVLVLSMYSNKEFVDELMAAGATGYVLKNTGREELREAIITVHSGQRYFAKPVQEIMDEANAGAGGEKEEQHVTISKREKEIVKLFAADKSLAEIADILHLSPATVETHRKNIYHKLGIHSSTALVKYAMERGWGNSSDGK